MVAKSANMARENDHRACVNAWMKRVAVGQSSARLVQSFDDAFAGLWRRAHLTLGDVTLKAIVDRVLCNAAEEFPFLAGLTVDAAGLRCQELHGTAASVTRDELADGVRFVLVEFLTVLGNLTANILTPALHAELSKSNPSKGASS
jgi:hypothetical protein